LIAIAVIEAEDAGGRGSACRPPGNSAIACKLSLQDFGIYSQPIPDGAAMAGFE